MPIGDETPRQICLIDRRAWPCRDPGDRGGCADPPTTWCDAGDSTTAGRRSRRRRDGGRAETWLRVRRRPPGAGRRRRRPPAKALVPCRQQPTGHDRVPARPGVGRAEALVEQMLEPGSDEVAAGDEPACRELASQRDDAGPGIRVRSRSNTARRTIGVLSCACRWCRDLRAVVTPSLFRAPVSGMRQRSDDGVKPSRDLGFLPPGPGRHQAGGAVVIDRRHRQFDADATRVRPGQEPSWRCALKGELEAVRDH